jgi:hypothetical protein
MQNNIQCPNGACRYQGPPELSGGSSWIIFILLLFLGIIPGLIYALVASGTKDVSCPRCGMVLGKQKVGSGTGRVVLFLVLLVVLVGFCSQMGR